MKALKCFGAVAIVTVGLVVGSVLADPPVNQPGSDRLVFITGSLIPQRVKVQSVGSKTTSPVRVINRREIEQTGRPTTPGALIDDPSLRIIGH